MQFTTSQVNAEQQADQQKIAQTIYDQIRTIDRQAFMAWGARQFVYTSEGLKFKVGGLAKFKGWVHIKYNRGIDLYDIEFLKVKLGLPALVDLKTNVDAFSLVSVLDEVIQ